jgi:trigger factor
MKKNIVKGKNANYEISITVDTAEYTKAEEKAVKHFQKEFELQGFRKGAVPLHLVKEKIRPEYLTIGVYEEVINSGLQEILAENADIRFIGEPYDINQDKKEDETTLTLKLDIYPTVEIKNDKWTKLTIPSITSEPTQEEIDKAMMQIKKNYADYQDADAITDDTVTKVNVSFLDKDGNEIHSTNTFVGEQEFAEDKFYATTFVGKKKDEEFILPYDEKKQPHSFHLHKEELAKPTQIKLKAIDIKKIVYPTFDEAMLQKLFGNESTVKNEADLVNFIKQTLVEQKAEAELVKAVEEYIQTVKKESMEVAIPATMINEEYKVRIQNLAQRFGGDQTKMQEYLAKMGEEQSKKFLDDIKKASGESLEKFFILRQVVDELKIDVNREKPEKLEIEHKLYAKLAEENGEAKKPAKKK